MPENIARVPYGKCEFILRGSYFLEKYTTPDGSIPYLDVLIHADKTTSVYRKPTHTNLYTHYSSSTPQSSKDSVISSLTPYALPVT